jgi:hypothetical protein
LIGKFATHPPILSIEDNKQAFVKKLSAQIEVQTSPSVTHKQT